MDNFVGVIQSVHDGGIRVVRLGEHETIVDAVFFLNWALGAEGGPERLQRADRG